MKKMQAPCWILIALIAGMISAQARWDNWNNASWTHRVKITIDHTKVDEDLADFPVFLSEASTGMQVFQGAQSSGADLYFTTESGTQLSHQIERFDQENQSLGIWVKVPLVSSTVDTVIYLYYGNPSAASQEDIEGVWSNGFRGVWHMSEEAAGTGANNVYLNSSGTNAHGKDLITSTGKEGKLGRGQQFVTTSSDSVEISPWIYPYTFSNWTASAWVKRNPNGARLPIFTGYLLQLETDGRIQSYDGASYKFSTAAVPANAWTHVAASYDQTTGKIRFYLNGQFSGEGNYNNAYVGSWRFYRLGNSFNGHLDEIRFDNVTRSDAWLAASFRNQEAPATFARYSAEEVPGLTNWQYRQRIVIDKNKLTAVVNNLPIAITKDSVGDNFWANVAANGLDIAFTSDNGVTPLSFEIETFDPATQTLVLWVKAPQVSNAVNATFYLYYGNPSATSQQDALAVWNNESRAVWHMDEEAVGTGTTYNVYLNSSGTNAHGKDLIVSTGKEGKIGKGQQFVTSSADKVEISPWVYPYTFANWTASAWIKRSPNGQRMPIFSNALQLENDGRVQSYDGASYKYSTSAVPVDTWTHVSAVYSQATGKIRFYIDGQFNGEGAYNNAYVGSWRFNFLGNAFNGNLDELRFDSVARDDAWMAANYQATVSPGAFALMAGEEIRDAYWTDTTAPLAVTNLHNSIENWGYDTTPSVTWNPAFDNSVGVARYDARIDGGSTVYNVQNGWSPLLTEGVHTIEVWAVDHSGNVGSAVQTSAKLDVTAPVVTGLPGNTAATTGDNKTIAATVSDTLSGIAESTLYYTPIGGAETALSFGTGWAVVPVSANVIGTIPYYVYVRDTAGNITRLPASGTYNISVTDNDQPYAHAGYNKFHVLSGASTAFTAGRSADNVGVSQYTWDFGDGSPTATGMNVSHAYAAPGYYEATVTIQDTSGLISQQTIEVWVAATTPLVQNGTATMPIVIASNSGTAVQAQANELKGMLDTITGATFSVVTGNGSTGIAVGTEADFPSLTLEVDFDGTDTFRREEYLLKSHAAGVYLIGATPLAVKHAVWDFLRQAGYRHFFPGEKWKVVPSNPTLAASVYAFEAPHYHTRKLYYGWGDWQNGSGYIWLNHPEYNPMPNYVEWCDHNRMTYGFTLNNGHNYNAIRTANQATFDAHPEYLALVSGTRQNSQLCLGNPAVKTIAATFGINYVTNTPSDSVSMEPNDNSQSCQDSLCAALGSVTDRVVGMANHVASSLPAGKHVGMYAYLDHAAPPTFTVNPNVVVSMARTLQFSGLTVEQMIDQWKAKGALCGIREYYSVSQWDRDAVSFPHITNRDYIIDKTRRWHEDHGVAFLTGETGNHWGVSGLSNILLSRMFWDVGNADASDEIIEDFLDKAFDAGTKEYMRDYFNRVDRSQYPDWSRALLGQMFIDLDSARSATANAEVKARIDDLILYCRYVDLYWVYREATGTARQTAFENVMKFSYRQRTTGMSYSYGFYRSATLTDGAITIPAGATFDIPEKDANGDQVNPWKTGEPFTEMEIQTYLTDGLARNPVP